MPQSLARIWLHIVFSTKERRAYLQNEDIREEMFRMLGYHAGQIGCPPARVGGWVNRVHVLCGLARTVTVAGLVEVLKPKRRSGSNSVHRTCRYSIGKMGTERFQ